MAKTCHFEVYVILNLRPQCGRPPLTLHSSQTHVQTHAHKHLIHINHLINEYCPDLRPISAKGAKSGCQRSAPAVTQGSYQQRPNSKDLQDLK